MKEDGVLYLTGPKGSKKREAGPPPKKVKGLSVTRNRQGRTGGDVVLLKPPKKMS